MNNFRKSTSIAGRFDEETKANLYRASAMKRPVFIVVSGSKE
jgi:hypothetical protein